ncbi:MAG: right-handed parallel beta-helix repeat-containing protein [Candidatus Riflebacteria bacterium]|nr:right-handed parallel beta-helix repeat-containing protein [Candidatus Riflebacteria bacterium]
MSERLTLRQLASDATMNIKRLFLLVGILVGLSLIGCESGNNVTSRDGGIQGTILDKASKPIKGVTVVWKFDESLVGQTDASGTFFIDGVEFGDQPFVARCSGYRDTSFTAPIYSGGITNLKAFAMETSSFDYKDIKVEEVSATHAIISWKTTDYTSGAIEFGETEALGSSVREPETQFATLHRLTITDLKAEKRYFFHIVANRQNRPSETSVMGDFTTPTILNDTSPPDAPKGIGIALTEQPNQVTIFWTPNTESDLKGYRIYRSELISAGFEALSSTIVAKGTEQYVDAGVVTGKKYYYRVAAVDQAGNEGSSSDIVSMLIPGDLSREVTWTLANSPYLLSGDLDIQVTGILHIDAGVVVKMATYDALRRGDPQKIEIRVRGGLDVHAGGYTPVTFSSDRGTPAAGDWGGVSILSAPATSVTLDNLVVAYAAKGLDILNTNVAIRNSTFLSCTTGISASGTTDLTISSLSVSLCSDGMMVSDNTRVVVENSTFNHCQRGISSDANDSATYRGNNFFTYVDFGLLSNEKAGQILIENNLFVSPVGVGLHMVDQAATVRYNTFDAPSAIRIDRNNPTIAKNIIVSTRSASGSGIKGIEHLAGVIPLPLFGPNDVYGFPVGYDYVGCASLPGSLASAPLFMRDLGGAGSDNDYRLRQALPSSSDTWGIQRSSAP